MVQITKTSVQDCHVSFALRAHLTQLELLQSILLLHNFALITVVTNINTIEAGLFLILRTKLVGSRDDYTFCIL